MMTRCMFCGGRMLEFYEPSNEFACERCAFIESNKIIVYSIEIDNIIYDIVFNKKKNLSSLFIRPCNYGKILTRKHDIINVNIFDGLNTNNVKEKIKKYILML